MTRAPYRVISTDEWSAIYAFEGWRVVVTESKSGRFHIAISCQPIDGVSKETHPNSDDVGRATAALIPDANEREFDLMAPILRPGELHFVEKGFFE